MKSRLDLYFDTTIGQLIEQMNHENSPQQMQFCTGLES